jgi:heme-degrading monooxygenase HmoA
MSLVVINAVTVADESKEDFETRFAARAGTVSGAPGFEAFELLRPLEGNRYLVYTRWASEEAFQGWMRSGQFSAESEVWRFEVLESEYPRAAE